MLQDNGWYKRFFHSGGGKIAGNLLKRCVLMNPLVCISLRGAGTPSSLPPRLSMIRQQFYHYYNLHAGINMMLISPYSDVGDFSCDELEQLLKTPQLRVDATDEVR